jgi:hypothetical protein
MPNLPEERLPMYRTASIGSWVGPAVINNRGWGGLGLEGWVGTFGGLVALIIARG